MQVKLRWSERWHEGSCSFSLNNGKGFSYRTTNSDWFKDYIDMFNITDELVLSEEIKEEDGSWTKTYIPK